MNRRLFTTSVAAGALGSAEVAKAIAANFVNHQ